LFADQFSLLTTALRDKGNRKNVILPKSIQLLGRNAEEIYFFHAPGVHPTIKNIDKGSSSQYI